MMKLITKCIFLFVLLAVICQTYAQLFTNTEALNQLADELAKEWKISQQKVQDYARVNNIHIRQELEDGRVRFRDPKTGRVGVAKR